MKALPRDLGLLSIPKLAKVAGRHRNSMTRILLALHARDREEGRDTSWLIRPHRKVLINCARLYRAHPALFDTHYVSREEFEDIGERVELLEERERESCRRINAVAARVRSLVEEKRSA